MHGKSLIRESVNGNQLLCGQQVRQLDKKTLTKNEEETTARWVQPGDVGPEIEENKPTATAPTTRTNTDRTFQ